MRLYFLSIFLFFHVCSFSQCVTSLHKLSPEADVSPYPHGFGKSIDIRGDVAVVGIDHSDSLQFNAGLAQVYEFTSGEWNRTAVLYPEEPIPNTNFGLDVKVTENYIFISSDWTQSLEPGSSYAKGTTPGAIYVFKKPATGWETMTENAKLDLKYGSYPIDPYEFTVAEQEDVIGLHSDEYIYFYVREDGEWSASDPFVRFDPYISSESIRSISMDNEILVLTTSYLGVGKVYIKRATDNSWTDFETLNTISRPEGDLYYFDLQANVKDDHLLVSSWSVTDSVFLYTTQDNWTTIEEEVVFTSQQPLLNTWGNFGPDNVYMNDSLIVIGRNSDTSEVVSVYEKPVGGWASSTEDRIINLPNYSNISEESRFAFTPDHMMIAGGFVDYEAYNSDHLLFYSMKNDPPQIEAVKTYKDINSTAMNFGRNMVLHDSILAVASYDNNREYNDRGEVHLYKRDIDDSWKKINTISPEGPQDKSIDFGASIAFYNDYLVIGAPDYYEVDSTKRVGRVFVYHKSGDWTNVSKVAELYPSDPEEEEERWMTLSFGEHLAIDEHTIVVGAPGKDLITKDSVDHGMIYVFEKSYGTEWQSSTETARLYSDPASGHARIGNAFVLVDSCIITPHYWTDGEDIGLISVFVKPEAGWKDTVETYVHEVEDTGYRAFTEGDIEVENDMLFIGNPYNRSDDHYGRIHVLKKMGDNWSAITKVNTLEFIHPSFANRPNDPYYLPKDGFGATFDVVDNILIAGIKFMRGRVSQDENRKGIAPVYQSLDSTWENVVELVEIEGDNYSTTDGFGYEVIATEEEFIISAREDDSNTGYKSGVVYVSPIPPTVKVLGPLCVDNGSVDLSPYATNATWSGNGIVDGDENLFHPDIAGPGTHELVYTTPDCYYGGKVLVMVGEKQKTEFKHDLEMELCENDSLLLEVTSVDSALYRWYYMSSEDDSATIIEDRDSSIYVHSPGKYWVELYNVWCPDHSDTVDVQFIPNTLNIDSLPLICDPDKQIQIEVTPSSGGVWHSNAVDADHIITPSLLKDGQNDLIYEFAASNTCTFYDTLSLAYDPLREDTLIVDSYELCQGELASIDLHMYPGTNYSLVDLDNTSITQITSSPIEIESPGKYQIQIEKHTCLVSSNVFDVFYYSQDSVLIPNVVTDNGDLRNDNFEVYVENAVTKTVHIYNRYGDLVYESRNYNGSWPDGNYPPGTYYYVCNFGTTCIPNRTAKGWVQLMK